MIVGPDGAAWITDGGLNAIVRVDPGSKEVKRFGLPGGGANLNTAAFDGDGVLWFTGQGGIYGRVDSNGEVKTYPTPKGRGPYGITSTPAGQVWFSSLAGSYIAHIDSATGEHKPYDVPTAGGGARRVWSDSSGKLWVTEWFAGKLARFDPASHRGVEGVDPAGRQPPALRRLRRRSRRRVGHRLRRQRNPPFRPPNRGVPSVSVDKTECQRKAASRAAGRGLGGRVGHFSPGPHRRKLARGCA